MEQEKALTALEKDLEREEGTGQRQLAAYRAILIFLRSMRRVPLALARATAREQSLRLRLALETHFVRHRAYPELLSELGPELLAEIPLDPCTGKPPRYERGGSGYRLWIGSDLQVERERR